MYRHLIPSNSGLFNVVTSKRIISAQILLQPSAAGLLPGQRFRAGRLFANLSAKSKF
jgi:hypothetical protein